MIAVNLRISERLLVDIEAEARRRGISKSDVMRERLEAVPPRRPKHLDDIADLIGAVDGLPPDLSSRTKEYLKAGFGRKRHR